MSYKNRLECYGRRVEIGEARPYVYFYDADRLKTVEEVARSEFRDIPCLLGRAVYETRHRFDP